MFEAIVLAGGFGTRLQEILKDIPKAMAPINGRPFLEYLLDYLAANGVDKVVLSVGHRSSLIMQHFGSEYRNLKIDYAIEEEPLGTGGGIMLAMEKCSGEHVLALNGDTLFLVGLEDFHAKHLMNKALISIALRRVDDVSRFGSVRIDESHKIVSFGEKSTKKIPGLINGGIYLINRDFFIRNTTFGSFSIEKDCFEHWYKRGWVSGFDYDAYFMDIGIPEDYHKAQDEFKKFKY